MRLSTTLAIGILATIALRTYGADSTPASSAPATTAVKAAVLQLGSENFSDRKKAARQLEAIFSQQALDLASATDPEVQGSLVPIMAYNEGLLRWLQDVLSLPQDQRNAQLALASRDGMLPIISRLFSNQTAQRVEAVHALSKYDNPDLDSLLARMISDDDRAVCLAAMEVAWDKKPTDLVVAALWHRAVEVGMEKQKIHPVSQTGGLTFRGQPVADVYRPRSQSSDADLAAETLVHLNADQIKSKLVQCFKDVAATMARDDVSNIEIMNLSGNSSSMQVVFYLLSSFKPRDAAPSLYSIAMHKKIQTFTYTDASGHYVATNRAAAIASLLLLADLPHDKFLMKDFPMNGGKSVWVVTNEKDEDDAIDQLKEWWAAHSKDYASAQ